MENMDLRVIVEKSGLKYQKIAETMGISPAWLCRLMKRKLTADQKLRIMRAIDRLKEGADQDDV